LNDTNKAGWISRRPSGLEDMIAGGWYCHRWVKGCSCSSSATWNNMKAKQKQYREQMQTK